MRVVKMTKFLPGYKYHHSEYDREHTVEAKSLSVKNLSKEDRKTDL